LHAILPNKWTTKISRGAENFNGYCKGKLSVLDFVVYTAHTDCCAVNNAVIKSSCFWKRALYWHRSSMWTLFHPPVHWFIP
jgi:hypothetical protein